jgi:mono/diheme cytochrome c family protein
MNKEEMMKKVLLGVAIAATLWLAASVSRAQDSAKGEKTFKAKCAGCHGADAAGKPAVKSPSIKGKSAEEITKTFSASPKHASARKLAPADVQDLAAYLATLK